MKNLTASEVADALGVSPMTVYRMVRDGRLASCRLPGVQRVLIPDTELHRLVAPVLRVLDGGGEGAAHPDADTASAATPLSVLASPPPSISANHPTMRPDPAA